MDEYQPNPPPENPPRSPSDLEAKIKNQVQDKETWLRLFYLLVFGVVFYAVFFITIAVALIQFIARMFSGRTLASLADFNATLADYARDLVAFLTFHSDKKPFPFKE